MSMLRTTKNPKEIISILKEVFEVDGAFTIWQRDDSKVISSQSIGTLVSLEEELGDVVFKLHDSFELDESKGVFLAVQSSQLVFRLETPIVVDGVLRCTLPDSIRYRERRKHLRTKVKRSESKEVELTFAIKKELDTDEKQRRIVSKLIDVSDGGACFVVSKETLALIDIKSIFYIKSLSSDVTINARKGMIVNARKYKGPSMGYDEMYSVGVMFLESSQATV